MLLEIMRAVPLLEGNDTAVCLYHVTWTQREGLWGYKFAHTLTSVSFLLSGFFYPNANKKIDCPQLSCLMTSDMSGPGSDPRSSIIRRAVFASYLLKWRLECYEPQSQREAFCLIALDSYCGTEIFLELMFLRLACVVWHVDCTVCALKARRFLNLDFTHGGNRPLCPLIGGWMTLRVTIIAD